MSWIPHCCSTHRVPYLSTVCNGFFLLNCHVRQSVRGLALAGVVQPRAPWQGEERGLLRGRSSSVQTGTDRAAEPSCCRVSSTPSPAGSQASHKANWPEVLYPRSGHRTYQGKHCTWVITWTESSRFRRKTTYNLDRYVDFKESVETR